MDLHARSYLSALIELAILFLPAIPAYLWVWPNLNQVQTEIFQVLVYLYFLAGGLFIGLRRWSWEQLGFNLKGFWVCLICGAALLGGRLLIILGVEWSVRPGPLTWTGVVRDLLFYFGCVGLVEELLFRGLIYRLLDDWRGVRWAIWGSGAAFGLWHIFGHGPLVGVVTFLLGLLFALIRLRAGGIVWLIALHALWDLESTWLLSGSSARILAAPAYTIVHPDWLRLGTLLLVFAPVFAGWVYPKLVRRSPSALEQGQRK